MPGPLSTTPAYGLYPGQGGRGCRGEAGGFPGSLELDLATAPRLLFFDLTF